MSKLYGVYVDSKLVVCVDAPLSRTSSEALWNKVTRAVWAEFSSYRIPNCNYLFDNGSMTHEGKKIYYKELPQ